MNKYIVISLFFIIKFAGCGVPYDIIDFSEVKPSADEIRIVSVGGVIFQYAFGKTGQYKSGKDYLWSKSDRAYYNLLTDGALIRLNYFGRVDSIITIQYQEFDIIKGELFLRPEFTEYYKYQMSVPGILMWKYLTVEILSSDSNILTYKILPDDRDK